MTSPAKPSIDLDDVVRAGGVVAAIHKWCESSDDTSSGVIGPSFSTSGPGPGWSVQHDVGDYASRALCEGSLYYLDADDGRLASAPEWEDGEYDGEPIEWSDESVVELVCPDLYDALEHSDAVAEMLEAVIDYHYPESDCRKWRQLALKILEAAEAIEDIDLDRLPEE